MGEGTCKSLKDKCENKRQVFRKGENKDKCLGEDTYKSLKR